MLQLLAEAVYWISSNSFGKHEAFLHSINIKPVFKEYLKYPLKRRIDLFNVTCRVMEMKCVPFIHYSGLDI